MAILGNLDMNESLLKKVGSDYFTKLPKKNINNSLIEEPINYDF